MIQSMIQKLMQEAQEEAEHKGFCDTEMGTNKMTRDAKTEEVASLKAESEELSANIMQLSEEIAALGKALAENDAALAKATAMREQAKGGAAMLQVPGAPEMEGGSYNGMEGGGVV